MKKISLLILLLFISSAYAQLDKAQQQNGNNPKLNELKFNVLLPLFGTAEATYERNLNDKSTLGISGLYVFGNGKSTKDEDTNYMITSFYRRYFGKKPTSGFFVEGFGMLSSIDGKKIYDTPERTTYTKGADVIDLSVGLGLGHKWVTQSGLTFEANVGWGKLLFNANKTDHDQVARFGVQVGYQF